MDWLRDLLQLATVLFLINIYLTVKDIRKVQSGGIGDDTMAEFGAELLKGAKELEEEKRKRTK